MKVQFPLYVIQGLLFLLSMFLTETLKGEEQKLEFHVKNVKDFAEDSEETHLEQHEKSNKDLHKDMINRVA